MRVVPETHVDRPDADASERGARRFRLARLAVVLGTVERAVTAAASFVRIPLLLWGLDLHDYGLWVAILGVVATANLLDFGLHFGVINAVSDARGRDDTPTIARTIATAFLTYGSIAALAAVALVPAVSWLPLGAAVGVGPEDGALVRDVALLGFGALILSMPLRVHAASLTGCQEQWIVSVFRSAQTLGQLAAIAVAFALFGAGLRAVAWIGFATEVASWGLFALWIEWRRPALGVRPGLASRALAPSLLATGATFFAINLANLLKMSLGSTILSGARGPEEVATLSVPLGLFTIALGISATVGASLWPAYGEAAARGEWSWISKAFALGTKASVGAAAFFAVLGAFFGADVVRLWAPKAGIPGLALTGALAAWLAVQAGVHAASSLLSGVGRLRAVTVACVSEGVAVLGASLAAAGPWGATGVAAVMAAGGALNAGFLLFVAVPRSTGGRVPAPLGDLARVLACAVAASVFAIVLLAALADAHPAVRLIAGAGPTAALLVASMWGLVLTPAERRRLLGTRARTGSAV